MGKTVSKTCLLSRLALTRVLRKKGRKFSRLASRIRGVPPREFPPCAEIHVAMITATYNKS